MYMPNLKSMNSTFGVNSGHRNRIEVDIDVPILENKVDI